MRFKLLRRRLTISAPRMVLRSAMPWPFRWVIIALVFGFCAAISLWAFEFGKQIAGLDVGSNDEVAQLRSEVQRLRDERDRAQTVANTSSSQLTTERTVQERMAAQIKSLEAENRRLRDDLGFFEKLLPTSATQGISIRALQAELVGPRQLKWQLIVVQPEKVAPEFNGKLGVSLVGTLGAKPWSLDIPGGGQALQMRQYRRVEGQVELPEGAVVKSISARVTDGAGAVRATQTIKL